MVNTAREAGAAANHAATNKNTKYSQLSNTHVFVPVAIETRGTCHPQAVELVQEIGRRTANITSDARESTFVFQQLSVALQRGNAVSFQNTFTAS